MDPQHRREGCAVTLPEAISAILSNAREHAMDRTRLFFVEVDGETCIGYVCRQRRGYPSRAERNRMRRFAHHVCNVRRLPFRIRCVDRSPGPWEVAQSLMPVTLPEQVWRLT